MPAGVAQAGLPLLLQEGVVLSQAGSLAYGCRAGAGCSVASTAAPGVLPVEQYIVLDVKLDVKCSDPLVAGGAVWEQSCRLPWLPCATGREVHAISFWIGYCSRTCADVGP